MTLFILSLNKASSSWPDPYDVMGFQECDSIERVITDAGNRIANRRMWNVQGFCSVATFRASWPPKQQDSRMSTPGFKGHMRMELN